MLSCIALLANIVVSATIASKDTLLLARTTVPIHEVQGR